MSCFRFCFVVLLMCGVLPLAWSKGMSVTMYFKEVGRDISKITFAHAVNSHKLLTEAIADPSIMMLEADIIMGTHSSFNDVMPVMAHPPAETSDLTFVQFLDAVINAIKVEGKRKGIKLDFKDILAVEPSLKYLRTRLDEEEIPSFPIIVNADILSGPVNATKAPLDAEKFIYLAKTYAPYAVLSVGWTTRYGMDDPLDEIREGKYTIEQINEMLAVIKKYATSTQPFPHITFPVRASLAAQSIDELIRLTGRVRQASIVSLTLWSPKTDSVNMAQLRSLVVQQTTRRTFVDLPFSLEEDKTEEIVEHNQQHQPHHPQQEQPVSEVQQLGARAHPEGDDAEPSTNGTTLSVNAVLPVIALGVLAAFFAYRHL